MYHMLRHLRNPDFRFPCQGLRKSLICLKIKKCCHKDFPCCYILRHLCQFQYSFGIHRSYRSYRFNKINPVLIFPVQNYIWHLVVQGYLKPQFCQFSTFFTKSFSIVSPTYKHSDPGAKRGANSLIIAFCNSLCLPVEN